MVKVTDSVIKLGWKPDTNILLADILIRWVQSVPGELAVLYEVKSLPHALPL